MRLFLYVAVPGMIVGFIIGQNMYAIDQVRLFELIGCR